MKKLSNKKLIFKEHGWFLKLSILLQRHSLRLSYAWQGNLQRGEITLVEIVEFIGKKVRSLSKRKTYSLIQEWISQPKEKDTSMQLSRVLSWGTCEWFSKRLGQPTYHFAIYCRNATASSLYSVCQWVKKQTKLLPESHLLTSTYLLTSTSRENNEKKVYLRFNRKPHMQWQGKITNFSSKKLQRIDHSNILWNWNWILNWIYEHPAKSHRAYNIKGAL